MKNRFKFGFSLITLSIIVTIVLILVTATTISVVNVKKRVDKLTFGEEMAIVQEGVTLYYEKNNSYPIDEKIALTQDTKVALNSSNMIFLDGDSASSEFYYINYSLIGIENSQDFKYIDTNSQDLVLSTNTGTVYYPKGMDGNYFFTDDLKKAIEYVDRTDSITSTSGIKFTKSVEEYTNNPIVTTIEVRAEYTNVTCTVIPSNSSKIELTGNNNKFVTPDDIYENYDIVVKWKENNSGNVNTTVYSVDNFDNIAPEVEIKGEKKSIENILTGEEKQYYFINYSDNLSGIKTLKYVEEKIPEDSNSDAQNLELIKEYMKNNGKNITKNVIEILPGTRWITVYAEDNASNARFICKEVPEIQKVTNGDLASDVTETPDSINDENDHIVDPEVP